MPGKMDTITIERKKNYFLMIFCDANVGYEQINYGGCTNQVLALAVQCG